MISYEDLKKWMADKSNQKILIITFGYVVIFFAGFGSGSFVKVSKQKSNKIYLNNNTNTVKKPENPPGEKIVDVKKETVNVETKDAKSNVTKLECNIKGNIATGGKKIYHLNTGAYYEKVKAEMCFNTEDEAKQAGFTKSAR